MHYTASPGAPAKNISSYFAGLSKQNPNYKTKARYASAQFSVDRTSIYNSIPDDELAYHCGSKTYTREALETLGTYPNNSTIGIEMCIEKDGSIHEDTFHNAAELVAYLIRERVFRM
ncbi:N-acetylmuramoyl-L-alanine amidase [Paenibacillus pinihumi]|uniref:N-acetylmuramoyl-L-alanine amidase n=1 Tax=Paenibacillus pinihumi TaxID=669462 RepID=UPI00040168BC|nr:N-acetylmuramoyl-L-alanine amidase [Paenibacillus pinihumi]